VKLQRQRKTVRPEDLVPQTHQGAIDDFEIDSYWLGPNGEIEPATFLLGDLCTWDYEARGFRLMKDKRQAEAAVA
jgi:hypothetical protein